MTCAQQVVCQFGFDERACDINPFDIVAVGLGPAAGNAEALFECEEEGLEIAGIDVPLPIGMMPVPHPWRSLLARQSTEFRLVPTKSTSPALLTSGARKSALEAKSVYVRVDLGGRGFIKQ